MLLSTDISLWEASTKAMWGSLDFCPVITQFKVQAISLAQLTTLSQMEAWGEAEKPQHGMAFLLIVPGANARCEQVFILAAMWVHPHQAHLPTLGKAAWKLMMLASDSPNWPYAYVQINNAMAHTPLSSDGHIRVTTDGLPSTYTCGHLDQLQV